jgi:hypothetical protein
MEAESKSMGSETIGALCGQKRKAEEETEEAAAVDVAVLVVDRLRSEQVVLVRPELEEVVYNYADSSDEDEDEDPEISLAKIKARFDARLRECQAHYPVVKCEDCSMEDDSRDDDKPV